MELFYKRWTIKTPIHQEVKRSSFRPQMGLSGEQEGVRCCAFTPSKLQTLTDLGWEAVKSSELGKVSTGLMRLIVIFLNSSRSNNECRSELAAIIWLFHKGWEILNLQIWLAETDNEVV